MVPNRQRISGWQLQALDDGERKILVADESSLTAADALTLSQLLKPYGVFNIKPMTCGGINKAAKKIAFLAKRAGIDLSRGDKDESIINIAAALYAAYSCAATKYLDLDGSFDLSKDMTEGGFVLQDGYLYPLNKPGLGLSKI